MFQHFCSSFRINMYFSSPMHENQKRKENKMKNMKQILILIQKDEQKSDF